MKDLLTVRVFCSLFSSQDGRVLMWDRRKPNKPATRIGEEGVPASPVFDIAASGSATVDRNKLKKTRVTFYM